jgi:hypothetical protein
MKAIIKLIYLGIIILSFCSGNIFSQFLDEFENNSINDWVHFAGDGNVMMDFTSNKDFAQIDVDARNDIHNVWWALIKRDVSNSIDLSMLAKNDYELRIEARVKVSNAPRRINLHLNTQRTTNFHSHLMEYEIPDIDGWHIISLTTDNFDAVVGDTIYAQLALMDWGIGEFSIKLDYFKVDVVNKKLARNDFGNPSPYHPQIKKTSEFSTIINSSDAAIISLKYKDENFSNWKSYADSKNEKLLSLNSHQIIVIKWDFDTIKESMIVADGLLELTLDSYQTGNFSLEELGQVRLVEIIDGNSDWNSESITFNSLVGNKKLDEIINPQPAYDLDLKSQKGDKRYFTISNDVLKRLISGKTLGLLLKAIGPVVATFKVEGDFNPKLHINISEIK